MQANFIYSPNYDFATGWLSKLHPFDGRKFSHAWNLLQAEYGEQLQALWLEPKAPVSDALLSAIHDKSYLQSLQLSTTIANVVEIGIIRYLPNSLLQKKLITPLRTACAGTVLATETALKHKSIAMNFGGGYHHAFADHGEGFSFFGDAALSIMHCRQTGLLKPDDTILMIDLDAHRGNGFEAFMGKDAAVRIFDMYNFQNYPGLHQGDPDTYPYMIPLKAGTTDKAYLDTLHNDLVNFLNENGDAKLVFYNAGNDIFESDRLGRLSVSYDGVVKRDLFVVKQIVQRNIPAVVMTSGGYSKVSYQLIAELAKSIIEINKIKGSDSMPLS